MDNEQDAYTDDDYIIEFVTLGSAMKVTAIDPETMREVSMIGDPKLPRRELAKAAVEKLLYVLEKEKHV